MHSKRAWIVYTVVRVLAFAVPFAIVMLGFPAWQWNWLAGAIVGAVVSLAVSYIFLRRERTRMSEDLAEARARRDQRMQLDKEEDAALDEAEEK